MNKHLHIVCLNVPYPPDYGGVFDLFYKIKYLSRQGVKIILHCFEYGRDRQPELEKYCENVFYYPRRKTLSFTVPYIVLSRKNHVLLERLLSDNSPVLLEGIHCTYYLYKGDLDTKKCFVRLHNVEFEYYRHLAKTEGSLFKKIYFYFESRLLKKYETLLAPKGNFLCVSRRDTKTYRSLGAGNVIYFPLFFDKKNIISKEGRGDFCLYHGNLSIPENEKAVIFIITEIMAGIDFPFKVAGKNPTILVQKICKSHGVELIGNPTDEQLDSLLEEAHIHILPSMNSTGIKIKMIHALLKGRFVVTNPQGVEGTPFGELCTVCRNIVEYRHSILELIDKNFGIPEKLTRQKILLSEFDPEVNAEKLRKLIFN